MQQPLEEDPKINTAMPADTEVTATICQDLLKDVWEKEEKPRNWKNGLIIKIPKKGDTSLCSNWRWITLLSVPSKIPTSIIFNTIKQLYQLWNVDLIGLLSTLKNRSTPSPGKSFKIFWIL